MPRNPARALAWPTPARSIWTSKTGWTSKATGPLLDRLDGLNTQLDMTVPQTVTLSLFQQLDPQWALLASVNWQDWSEFGDIARTGRHHGVWRAIDDGRRPFQGHLATVARRAVPGHPQLLWNVGVAYDSSAVSDANRTFTVPMGESWRIATGATYALNKDTDINVSWAMVWLGDMPVDQTKSMSGIRTSGRVRQCLDSGLDRQHDLAILMPCYQTTTHPDVGKNT